MIRSAAANAQLFRSEIAHAWRTARAMSLLRTDFLLAGLALQLLGLALPLTMLQVFDRIIPRAAMSTLQVLCFGLAGCLLLEALLREARDAFLAWESARQDYRTATRVVRQMTYAPVSQMEARPLGAHLDRLHSVETVREFYSQQAVALLTELPFLLAYGVLLACIGGLICAIPLALAAIYAIPAWRRAKRCRPTCRRAKRWTIAASALFSRC